MSKELENFEKLILDGEKTGPIKYRVDNESESTVRYGFLCDTYGDEVVQGVILQMGINPSDLSDPSKFDTVVGKLKAD